MNWGHGLTLSFIAFAGLMIFMAVKSFQQNIDLVTEDYYQAEIKYQQRIDEIENVDINSAVNIHQFDQYIQLVFKETPESGSVHLYRPSDSQFDQNFNITDLESSMVIPLEGVTTGLYVLKISWESRGKKYYQQKHVTI